MTDRAPDTVRLGRVVEGETHITRRVVEHIKDAIDRGLLAPGVQLPAERELAQQLGVSRTSLREATRALEALGYLEVRHGQGVFVLGRPPGAGGWPRLSVDPRRRKTLRDLFAVRKVLESQAAFWAAQAMSEEEVAGLTAVAERMADAVARGAGDVVALDTDFHMAIFAGSHNEVLVRIMEGLLALLQESRAISLSMPGRASLSVQDHRRIVEAIARGDAEGAGLAMRQHVEDVERNLQAVGVLDAEDEA